jgi:hypothetical protein
MKFIITVLYAQYYSCLQQLHFNETGYVDLPKGWSVVESYTPPHGIAPTAYYFDGTVWNASGHRHAVCQYSLSYSGVPSDLVIMRKDRVAIYGPNWTEVVGMAGVYDCPGTLACPWF